MFFDSLVHRLYIFTIQSSIYTPYAFNQVKSFHSADDEDWRRGWSDAVVKQSTKCPACGGALKAIGLTPDERARIRDTLFGLAGLQVKKHARSRRVQRLFVHSTHLISMWYCCNKCDWPLPYTKTSILAPLRSTSTFWRTTWN